MHPAEKNNFQLERLWIGRVTHGDGAGLIYGGVDLFLGGDLKIVRQF